MQEISQIIQEYAPLFVTAILLGVVIGFFFGLLFSGAIRLPKLTSCPSKLVERVNLWQNREK